MTTISRSMVAAALDVAEDTLPPGDLPLDRFADRHAGWLAIPDEQRESHADLWTFDLMVALVQDHPDLAFAAVQATRLTAAQHQSRSPIWPLDRWRI